MSMLSDIFWDIFSLFAPRTCPVCGEKLPRHNIAVCTLCEVTAPLTNLWQESHNAMTERFWGILPIERAAALFWYVDGSEWREAIHRIKYSGAWLAAYNLGRWYGTILKESGNFDDVDKVVAVPLHWARRMQRGYNQSEYIAKGIAHSLGVEADTRSVRRYRYNRSQTTRHKTERWDNVEGIFRVRSPKKLNGKHILLVDDVFTTGATILSLGETILKATTGCRLSVATLAASRRGLGQKE